MALLLTVEVTLPGKQLPLFVEVLRPISPVSFHPSPVPAAFLPAHAVLPWPVGLSGLNVLRVLPAEHCQAIHAVVGDVVSKELREAGGHHPHAAAFVTFGNNRKESAHWSRPNLSPYFPMDESDFVKLK